MAFPVYCFEKRLSSFIRLFEFAVTHELFLTQYSCTNALSFIFEQTTSCY